jgi:hypothetical protein
MSPGNQLLAARNKNLPEQLRSSPVAGYSAADWLNRFIQDRQDVQGRTQ